MHSAVIYSVGFNGGINILMTRIVKQEVEYLKRLQCISTVVE